MTEGKRVKDIMVPIGEYEKVDVNALLCDVLVALKKNWEKAKIGGPAHFHKTVFVIDSSKKIVGKISVYDLIRGLVPESSIHLKFPKKGSYVRTSRIWEIEGKTDELLEQIGWLSRSFVDLVKQEAQKKIKDIMAPIDPILKEEDTINQAMYIMFKKNLREPLVVRNGEVIGVLDLTQVFSELLETVDPECYVHC
jgi:Mg/Co/Ni transporter MgtE